MSSTIKVNNIQNLAGDDSGFDLSTNDVVAVKTANTERMRIDASGKVGIGTTSPDTPLTIDGGSTDNTVAHFKSGTANTFIKLSDSNTTNGVFIGATTEDMTLFSNNTERVRIDSSGNLIMGQTTATSFNLTSGFCFDVRNGSGLGVAVQDNPSAIFNRTNTDGNVVLIRHNGSSEGIISVSGSTVTYGGFSGQHESSGIATNTPIGTVVSTIDELDVYASKQGDAGEEEDNPKAGQTRKDHAKVEVSDTVGDSAVYGVVASFNAQGKVNVASVGIGSVRVTGACAKGDLLESNGDGTAKVQDDDIVRSKTIGKVTIGNSDTKEKLVSCVLYCG